MARREYKGAATQTTLTSSVTSNATTLSITAYTGWPTGSFTMIIDPGLSSEEKILCTSRTSGSLTVTTRGYDDTAASAHSAGAICYPAPMAKDFDEANAHIAEVTTAHGLTLANLVKTTDTGVVTSAMITDGTIVDADVNTSAAIAKTKIAGTAVTLTDTGTVTSAMLLDGTIVSADINASAAIPYSKLSLAGTITSSDIANSTILDADINTNAAIAWTKLAPSATVSAVELGYVAGVTSGIQAQIDAKLATATAATTYAPIASPTLTGVPAAPTASSATNTTQIATTAFVGTAVSNLVNGATAALDTLNELATALGNDANFSTTVAASIATKLPLAGGTMSGAIAMGTSKITGLGTPTVSTDAATKAYADSIVATSPSNLTGPITSVGSATSIASQTGTGTKFVMEQSPALVTPSLGVATATSINATPIPASKTLVATDSTTYVVPSQVSQSGKFLTTDGTTSSWAAVVTDPTPTTLMLGGM